MLLMNNMVDSAITILIKSSSEGAAMARSYLVAVLSSPYQRRRGLPKGISSRSEMLQISVLRMALCFVGTKVCSMYSLCCGFVFVISIQLLLQFSADMDTTSAVLFIASSSFNRCFCF